MNRRLIPAALLSLLTLLSVGAFSDRRQPTPSVKPKESPRISFVNDVVPALTRAGCNQGTCHGAAAGKNGFKLSLRGYAPELDYISLTRQGSGRRVCKTAPEESLLLKKPALEIAHRGGLALKRGTPEYEVIASWLAQGAPGPTPKDTHVMGLDVETRPASLPHGRATSPPGNGIFMSGAAFNLRVMARFSDGSRKDVTYWARFATNDENVALVKPGGSARMVGEGETAITVGYQDKVAIARVAVPYSYKVDTAAYRSLPRNNYIDELVYAKLSSLHIWPSRPTTDAEFARRLCLDLTGTLPTPEELKVFSADSSPKKREMLIDSLMARPEFVDFWTYKWCDLLRVNRGTLKDKGMWAFYAWVHECVRSNMPWNKMAREVLTSTGNTFLDGPANYFRTALKPEEMAENVSQGFLGIRVQCAKCHNHPLEKWTQNEYYGMANLFARVQRKVNLDVWVNDEMTVYNTADGDVIQPRLGRPIPPKPLGGPVLTSNKSVDRRVAFADWLTGPNNKQFARSITNRVWAHFMGRGLVEAVDDLRETNPPTNPALLDALADDLVKHDYDLRWLMRRIVISYAYQRSSDSNPRNRKDDRYYSRYLVKRLTAEQLLDALSQVTGQPEAFPGMPVGYRADQLPDTHVKSEFMDSFGRPARQVTCECERSQEPSMEQALLFINGDVINRKVTADGGLVDRLIKSGKSNDEILSTLYLTALGRSLSQVELSRDKGALNRALALEQKAQPSAKPADSLVALKAAADKMRRRALEDMLWVLVNSKEFLFNH